MHHYYFKTRVLIGKMKNLLFQFLILILIISSCNNGKIKISGTITGYPDSIRIILYNLDTQEEIDTSYILNNQFSFIASKSEPIPHGLFIGKERDYLFLWLEDKNVKITGKKDSLKYAVIKGGAIQKQDNDYQNYTKP